MYCCVMNLCVALKTEVHDCNLLWLGGESGALEG